jgi:hypothetical protein
MKHCYRGAAISIAYRQIRELFRGIKSGGRYSSADSDVPMVPSGRTFEEDRQGAF